MVVFANWIYENFFLINVVVLTFIIILERKSPEKTIAWILVIVFLPPLVGAIVYLFLGRNWGKHQLNGNFIDEIDELVYDALRIKDEKNYISMIELLGNNSHSPIFINNEIEIYNDGNKKFNALKSELLNAKDHIHMEYFIIKSDIIGKEIINILIKKANEGVEVRLIFDRLGSRKLKRKDIKEMKVAGIDIAQYNYVSAPLLNHVNTQLNYRNHRKIVVIDGITGFIGGINIGDEYLGMGKLGFWRDTHIMVRGDFVQGLQSVFIDDFMSTKMANKENLKYNLDFNKYFINSDNTGTKAMQLVMGGPNSNFKSLLQLIIKMVSMAKKHIYITSPYFVPPDSLMEVLKIASLSGIEIVILFPGKFDHFIVYYASKTYLYDLMRHGCKVYLYDKDSFIHSKVITVDSKICTVGTTNIDVRSFDLNYEVNAVIYDEEITEKFEVDFFEDLKKSRRITIEEIENSPAYIKIIESTMRVFSYLL